ncbi:MAG: hypothetical protein ACLQPD_29250 [Desulfomonilaceae bacterium]
MTSREEILKRIRFLGKGTRGASPAILGLADGTLWEVFEQLKRGLTCRAVARFLRSIGMKASENSLQQSISLFRQRIAPLLTEESATPSLPAAPVKIPPEVSVQPPDEMLSTVRDIVRNYGESIRQVTEAAVRKGTPIGEDLSKHIKAYSTLVATKARLEQTVMKDRPVEPPQDKSFQEQADRAHEYLTSIGWDGDKMRKISERFLKRMADKCILLEKDRVTGEYHKVTGRPKRTSNYDPDQLLSD